ncbi:aminoglycoside phosphotransferase family protein [Flavihumibacter rivuli]|uniref:phosphotransferase enzyme family protein n=1 Tax=Flavihumibacter rivuli TaxID=2838156 RepID=UPI001BDE491B|nr:aminoglycoside phosphotransferase family protein [Flavihumibacter rivuli]ULQ57019.1 aminoglycoside phosphotransferase family protein [Flavihumibacter rivuli]
MVQSILPEFNLETESLELIPYGSGLINTTWKINHGREEYILQRINHLVFKKPFEIAENIRKIADYLEQHSPGYLFVTPIRTRNKQELAFSATDGYFRLFHFVKGSHTTDVVGDASEAYHAARQFGRFTALLAGFDASQLHETIPDFHNLALRFRQFRESITNGNQERVTAARQAIDQIMAYSNLVDQYEKILHDPAFRTRVIHHDTKISNVLLDKDNKGLCVIDLDTVMPGYFISDVGDMMRTYLSPATEEETDLSKNEVRDEIFRAIVKGYLEEMGELLTAQEREAILYAGKFMIYMQALRFLTDHFNNDSYYGTRYPGHNYNRALNQLDLLDKLCAREPQLKQILEDIQ